MMKDNQKKFNWIPVLIDACIIIISYILAYYLRFYVLTNAFDLFKMGVNEKFYSLKVYTDNLILLVPVYLFIYYFLNLYTPIHNKHRLREVLLIILANILGIVLFLFVLYLRQEFSISRKFIIVFVVINIALGVGLRLLYSYSLKFMHNKQQLNK